jgi:hypothetical protein
VTFLFTDIEGVDARTAATRGGEVVEHEQRRPRVGARRDRPAARGSRLRPAHQMKAILGTDSGDRFGASRGDSRRAGLTAERSCDRELPASRERPVKAPSRSGPRRPLGILRDLRVAVLRPDNTPRVRDGYISLGTRGHGRARKTRRESTICRRNMIESARPCPPVLPTNLHGKEGVDGSSPSEGFDKVPANWHFIVVCLLNTRTHSGHICGTRDAPRRLATPADTVPQPKPEQVARLKPCSGS